MATTGYIYDSQDGRCLARVIDGEKIFDATSADDEQIGTVSGGKIFDLQGNLVGHLRSNDRLKEADSPEAFYELLKGRNGKD